MKILIIEDEPLVAKDLENLIRQAVPDVSIVGVISSVASARRWFESNAAPQLIFSDIQLSDGISFEVYEQLNIQCPIIFTTAYDEYAIRAFKLNSIDYLLKPVDVTELKAALDKYTNLVHGAGWSEQIKVMLSQWDHPKKYKERFLALHRNALVPVTAAEVICFHKEELIYLHTIQNEKYISDHQTLDELESLLNPSVFFRVNRQYIIHIQSVSKIKTTHKGITVALKEPFGIEIDISREKAAAFKTWVG